jgi:outer membrane protein TolC
VKKNFDLLQDRWKETKGRASVGRNRQADVAALEGQLRTMEAQTMESERLVQAQRDLLSFFTGRPITEALSSFEMRNVESTPIQTYIEHTSSRPDVKAQEAAVDVANGAVRVERSNHFPTLDLGANYYLDRTGYREDVKWDAILNLEVPIWSWGATQKGVNAAKADLRRQELVGQEMKRRAQLEVQNAYRNVVSAHRQADTYQKASAAANREHQLTSRDYQRGLVTTFEVLETMNRFVDTERGLNLATLNARLAEVNLKIAAGYTPEEILQ